MRSSLSQPLHNDCDEASNAEIAGLGGAIPSSMRGRLPCLGELWRVTQCVMEGFCPVRVMSCTWHDNHYLRRCLVSRQNFLSMEVPRTGCLYWTENPAPLLRGSCRPVGDCPVLSGAAAATCGDEEKLAWACASWARKDGGEEVSQTKSSAYLHRATAGSLAGSWISLISGPASRSLDKELCAFPCLLARWLCCWLEFLAHGGG